MESLSRDRCGWTEEMRVKRGRLTNTKMYGKAILSIIDAHYFLSQHKTEVKEDFKEL